MTSSRNEPTPAADELIAAAAGSPAAQDDGSLRTALANAMVGLKKGYWGRGPEAAKAWMLGEYVFVALEGGLTRHEETLLAAGKEDLVRNYRLAFQEAMGDKTTAAVEELTGRQVIGYHSQITFRPTRSFEIFVLAPEGAGS